LESVAAAELEDRGPRDTGESRGERVDDQAHLARAFARAVAFLLRPRFG
jgi:hypothetical protein